MSCPPRARCRRPYVHATARWSSVADLGPSQRLSTPTTRLPHQGFRASPRLSTRPAHRHVLLVTPATQGRRHPVTGVTSHSTTGTTMALRTPVLRLIGGLAVSTALLGVLPGQALAAAPAPPTPAPIRPDSAPAATPVPARPSPAANPTPSPTASRDARTGAGTRRRPGSAGRPRPPGRPGDRRRQHGGAGRRAGRHRRDRARRGRRCGRRGRHTPPPEPRSGLRSAA